MTKYNPPRIPLFWLVMIAFFVFIVFAKMTWASDHSYDDDDANVEVSTEVISGDNVNTGGSYRSLALANALGDAAISNCVVTKQLSVVVVLAWQGFEYDLMCVAREMDEAGKYAEAATLRCQIKDLRKAFRDNCETALNFKPSDNGTTESSELTTLVAQAAQHNKDEDERQREYADRLVALEQLFDKQEADSHRVAQQQQVQQQQYQQIQRAEEARMRKIELIREEFGNNDDQE